MSSSRQFSWRGLVFAAAWASLSSPVAAIQEYCSPDNTGSDFNAVTNIYNSNGACFNVCSGSGYAFAIVQYQNCWCSNYAPADTLDVSNCDQNCPGFPKDKCGNEPEGLYGYIALSAAPSGTIGGDTSTSSTTTATPVIVSAIPTSSQPQSVSSSTTAQTVTAAPTPNTTRVVTVTSTASSSTAIGFFGGGGVTSTPAITSASQSVEIVTVSGAPVTLTVTTIPTVGVTSSVSTGSVATTRNSSLSGGAIAGIAIGAVAGVVLVALLAWFLWRRRNRDPDAARDRQRSLGRNVSVLSRAGLVNRGPVMTESRAEDALSHTRTASGPAFSAIGAGAAAGAAAAGTQSSRHSMLFGSTTDGAHPESPLGSSHSGDGPPGSRSRRHSRPLVYDQRLNPSALFANHDNGSRISMQDQQDYSRPLGVVNPDPEMTRLSFDSRSD